MSFRAVVGKIERRNPLPPGRYWVDVFEASSSAWQRWLAEHKDAVRVVGTQAFPGPMGSPAREWFLFEVSKDVPWQGPGLPTIADAGVTTAEDTATRPAPEPDLLPTLDQTVFGGLEGLRSAGRWIFAAVLAAGVLYALGKGKQ